jgi:type IV pilus assembly protein PilA
MLNKRREGFTLIELLIVVVIIGILAAIAIPKFSATREKAYYSAMKSDLRNLQSAQEMYYASPTGNYNYLQNGSATSAASLAALDNFTASQGVTVTLGANGTTAEGWIATATHSALPGASCEVYVGPVNASSVAPGPGVVACEDADGNAQ